MADRIQTTWMWHDEASTGVKGANVDLDDQIIQWVDQPGCACGDNSQQQSIADFLRQGAIGYVPDDIQAEMVSELIRLSPQIKES